jgi:hypothetical protein
MTVIAQFFSKTFLHLTSISVTNSRQQVIHQRHDSIKFGIPFGIDTS